MHVHQIAHIPNVNGYNPIAPEYGDARILAFPSEESPRFATVDDAIAAASAQGNLMDTAAAVFQAADGAYRIGLAVHQTPEGPEEFMFGPSTAAKIVFDDPTLQALVWLDTVARR